MSSVKGPWFYVQTAALYRSVGSLYTIVILSLYIFFLSLQVSVFCALFCLCYSAILLCIKVVLCTILVRDRVALYCHCTLMSTICYIITSYAVHCTLYCQYAHLPIIHDAIHAYNFTIHYHCTLCTAFCQTFMKKLTYSKDYNTFCDLDINLDIRHHILTRNNCWKPNM